MTESVEILKKIFDENHPNVKDAKNNLQLLIQEELK